MTVDEQPPTDFKPSHRNQWKVHRHKPLRTNPTSSPGKLLSGIDLFDHGVNLITQLGRHDRPPDLMEGIRVD